MIPDLIKRATGLALMLLFFVLTILVVVPSVGQTFACVAFSWMDPTQPPRMEEYRKKFYEEHSTQHCIVKFHKSYFGEDIWKILRIRPGH